MTQPPQPPPGSYPPPPPGNYPPPPPGNYPPPPPPGVGVLSKEAYTPWIKRVGAWVIDAIPPGILVGIGEGLAFATGENNCTSSTLDNNYGVSCTSQPSGLGMILLFVFILAGVVFGLWNLYRQGKTGSTIGKSVLKFKVISERTGQPIGFGLSIVRQIAHFVDGIICYIGYLFPLWDAKRQTIADKIMSTICVPL
ncbi:RDD family protein [Mycolicibacterium helvum]|uniref:RDD domain-containing protein n=1 Tax=Mycolicibacterium helvum TaxID=1534349 RepID=A0A7I7T168_9MYCO|nr:RDD family protein [Mycolicibacterium helvum]BBY62798.1 hypothetical protein MHEL_10410 [Mycolicibacterium helvum]